MRVLQPNLPVRREELDFEKLGFNTMLEVGDERLAIAICGRKLQAFERQFHSSLHELGSRAGSLRARSNALWSNLYDRPIPVKDSVMLSKNIIVSVLLASFLLCLGASVACHLWTFLRYGISLPLSLAFAITLSLVVTFIMHQLFEHLYRWRAAGQAAVIVIAVAMCLWSAIDFARARSMMLEHEAAQDQATSSGHSYVDNSGAVDSDPAPTNADSSSEARIKGTFGDAIFKIMIAADLVLGLILALLLDHWKDPDLTAWREIKKLGRTIRQAETHMKEIESVIAGAKELCVAGILSAQPVRNRRHPSYHQFLPLLVIGLCLSIAPFARAQSTKRAEAILIDVSGTIGRGGNHDLLAEYLASAKQLLLAEPPQSRVWVSVITTDSFGATRPLLKGWTPASRGVFTDDLTRSRRELAAAFEKRTAGLRAISAGTDIIGALWQAKDVLDSQTVDEREVWIFSDMMNETAVFPMPALLPRGAEAMIAQAEAAGLVVPLKGYNVHLLGASFQGLSPTAWETVKSFWICYLRKAGATLVTYSPDPSTARE